ncbi:hypothetical protein Lser_V15G20494 [Lactuca serriola]
MAENNTGILNSEQCPQFFKFYMPAHCSTQLRIPPAFLKYFGDSLPFKFNLITCSRNSWKVDMNKIDDDVYFKSGWEKFVQDNSLEFGDFLIFYYNGGSDFFVSISGKNNCLKENNNNTESENQSTPIQETETETNTTTGNEQIEDSNFSFDIKIQPCYLRNQYMNLPRVFYEGVKEEYRSMAKLQHLGRTWDVKVVDCCDRIRFTDGWRVFAMENCLGVGDVCCFKLVDVKPEFYSLDVSFCREM